MKVEIALATTKQQMSDEFKRWFKNSKVVDAAHRPLRCYHGTYNDVAWFDPGHHGKQDFGYLGVGFYLTARTNISNSYATSRNEGGNVMPLYVSMQNPYIITAHNFQDPNHGYLRVMAISQELQSRGLSMTEANRKAAVKYRSELEHQGYDGIIDNTDGAMTQIVAFFSQQMKSAIGNRGTFDPDSRNVIE